MSGQKPYESVKRQLDREPPAHPPNHRHLFQFWNGLTAEQQDRLADQVDRIDFDHIQTLHSKSETADASSDLVKRADAPKNLVPADIALRDPERLEQATKLGWQALADGRVAIILVAGGEGSRLGFPHPKGQFPIGPVSSKSLYQLLAEQALAISRRAGSIIPYYVMTSDATHQETMAYFKVHSYFGYDAASLHFFQQGNLPAVDKKTGKVLMSGRDSIAFSPNGHGGVLEAMSTAKIFDDLRRRNIEVVFYHQVDNPLAKVCDPAFIGFHLMNQAEVSTKVVEKVDEGEKVGLLVEIDQRHHIIEYVDLPTELAGQLEPSGKLKLRCGNIAIHLFSVDFLERMAAEQLPYHRSSKKVPFIDDSGNLSQPEENNAYKFERFIFDILPRATRPCVMEVIRENEFVPLKNSDGQFSPEDVRSAMRRLHTGWMKKAGWTTYEELPVEIPPAVALDEADFVAAVTKPARE